MNLSEKTCSFINNYPDIIKNSDYIKLRDIPRHGYTNTFDHSMRVARLSYLIAERLGADKESAVKAALLHDFCLIDYRAEDYKKPEGESCYLIKHPKDAVINSREYRTIYSHCLGIWQHYTFNWQINKNDGSFVLAERTNHASMTIRLVIEKVLPTMTMDDRRRFRYLVARALDGAGVFVLDDFSVKKIIRMFKVWGCQPWSEQKFLWSILFKVLKAIPSCQRKATRENKYSDKATKSYFWLKKHGCKIVLDHNGVKRVVSDKTKEQK